MSTHILFVFAGWSMTAGGDTRRRVRVALEFLRQEPRHRGEWYVVCLGGRFNEATKTTSAATRMREWMLAEELLPAGHIFAETHSRDSVENLTEGFALLSREGIDTAHAELILVTHPWHAERIQQLLKTLYHRTARVVPAWHYLSWAQRLSEIGLSLYLKFDPRGEGRLLNWVRQRRGGVRYSTSSKPLKRKTWGSVK